MTASYPEETRQCVEKALRRYFPQTDERIAPVTEAMAYALFAPGKRFRPILTLLCAEAVGGDKDVALPSACAIEYIHTYSLIHDDLPALDNDDLRRGQPTCHKKFGEGMAILAGDALLTEAFGLVASEQAKTASEALTIRVLSEIAHAAGVAGMVGGQTVDIVTTGKESDSETLEYIHNRKTGALIKAAAIVGAILGGGREHQVAAIARFAVHLGLAFQIVDDVLDVVGSAGGLGKPIGSDEKKKKKTYALLFGVDYSRKAARAEVDRAISALDSVAPQSRPLIDLAEFVLTRSL